MRVGVPKEIKSDEYRVGMMPVGAEQLVRAGHLVFVEAQAGVELYGGLDCTNGWTWSEAGRTTLTADPDSVPLKLTSGIATSRVENFTVMALDATQPGGSSIAAIIDNVTAELA